MQDGPFLTWLWLYEFVKLQTNCKPNFSAALKVVLPSVESVAALWFGSGGSWCIPLYKQGICKSAALSDNQIGWFHSYAPYILCYLVFPKLIYCKIRL